jgi:hypothetical protein
MTTSQPDPTRVAQISAEIGAFLDDAQERASAARFEQETTWVDQNPMTDFFFISARGVGRTPIGEVPNGSVVRFPDETRGEFIVSRSESVFPSCLRCLVTRDVETGEYFFRYALENDTLVAVLSEPADDIEPSERDGI